MKKILLSILIITLSSYTLFAQHDVKINIFGALFKNYGVGYEYIINEELSVAAFTSYSNGTLWSTIANDLSDENLEYSNFNLTPEIRYYINPDFGADKRYVGAYLRYQTLTWKNLSYYNDQNQDVVFDLTNNGIGFGITTGQKWVTDSGIYFETLLGIGRFITSNNAYSDPEAAEYYSNTSDLESFGYISSWDFRFQISVGYRIGGY